MSTLGVKRLMVSELIRSGGAVTAELLKKVDDYAKLGAHTAGEKAATVQPQTFLAGNRALAAAGIAPDTIHFANDEARNFAERLAGTYGLAVLFPGAGQVPGTNPGAPPANETRLQAAARSYKEALAKGKDLGTSKDWKIQTSGADLAFSVNAGQFGEVSALHIRKPEWKDKNPKNVLAANMAEFGAVRTAADLSAFIQKVVAQEAQHFGADGVGNSSNERFGVQALRRDAFIQSVGSSLGQTQMSGAERGKAGGVLLREKESMFVDRDFRMDVGSNTNYWPYWNNYLEPLLKLADMVEPNSAQHKAIKNRCRDILRRKTVFNSNRQIDEKDFEGSLGGALIHHPQFSDGVGHRVSVKPGDSNDHNYDPVYNPEHQLISVNTDRLPANLAQYAGAQVVRDDDGALKFDFMGDKQTDGQTGEKIPADLEAHLTTKDLSTADLTKEMSIREFQPGERARNDISADWNGNGSINVAAILIGWWGHCHNEAPANAMGIDPRKGVAMVVLDDKVALDKIEGNFTQQDAWDTVGLFTADHEGGYSVNIDRTTFVGERNNGGHWLHLELPRGSLKIDAEVTELWNSENTERYPDPMARFRRHIENDDGTFSVNPKFVESGLRDEDEIIVDISKRKASFKTKYMTLNDQGRPYEANERVTLDPQNDAFVKVGEQLEQRYRTGGGKVTEHYFNAKTEQYKSVTREVKREAGGFETNEIAKTDPVQVRQVRSQQETTYDSPTQIHDFVTSDMGLPSTFDTSSGMAVWNYPVNFTRVDRLQEITKEEDGEKFTYTTYKLNYTTMGGPGGNPRYIIKRNEAGDAIAATALDPMPDFAYRNDEWTCAPILDQNGRQVLNRQAMEQGYMTNGANQLETAVWDGQARVLFAALSGDTAEDKARVAIDKENGGRMLSFGNDAEYQGLVDAYKELREAKVAAGVA